MFSLLCKQPRKAMESTYLQDRLDQIERENNLKIEISTEANSLRYKKGLKEIREALASPVLC